VFMAIATAISSTGHGLRLTEVSRSTQPCIPSWSLNRECHLCRVAGNTVIPAVSSRSQAGLLTKGEPRLLTLLLRRKEKNGRKDRRTHDDSIYRASIAPCGKSNTP